MAKKPEDKYIDRVHRQLPPRRELFRMKNFNPMVGGTPDYWYSGNGGDLWVEYKFLPAIAKEVDPLKYLSALQADWLNCQSDFGRKCSCVLGSPDGAVILINRQWNFKVWKERFTLTPTEVAEWIKSCCQLPPD